MEVSGIHLSALNRVDWNFPGARTNRDSVHALHWFPGNFIPQIPSFLIQALSAPNEIVLDPFCGSGTTGVEALRLGRIAWQSDSCSASIQVTRGKLAAYCETEARSGLEQALETLLLDPSSFLTATPGGAGTDPRLADWFHPTTYLQLQHIWNVAVANGSTAARPLLEMLFADTLFACAASGGSPTKTGGIRRHHWGWVADNVRPAHLVYRDAFAIFRGRIAKAKGATPNTVARVCDQCRVDRTDARSLKVPDESVDLIVTSPPYLGMIDYTTANRLTYYWMGWSIEDERKAEVGARYARNRGTALKDYESAFSLIAEELFRVLRPQRYCALVIGSSRKFPNGVDAAVKCLERSFQIVQEPFVRRLTRRRVAERGGTDASEYIYVFRKRS